MDKYFLWKIAKNELNFFSPFHIYVCTHKIHIHGITGVCVCMSVCQFFPLCVGVLHFFASFATNAYRFSRKKYIKSVGK